MMTMAMNSMKKSMALMRMTTTPGTNLRRRKPSLRNMSSRVSITLLQPSQFIFHTLRKYPFSANHIWRRICESTSLLNNFSSNSSLFSYGRSCLQFGYFWMWNSWIKPLRRRWALTERRPSWLCCTLLITIWNAIRWLALFFLLIRLPNSQPRNVATQNRSKAA